MSNTYSVVIAEDEELLLKNLVNKVYSLNLGLHVAGTAQTGEQALEQIRLHSPDILITDIHMPVVDGMELLRQVSEGYPNLKSIIISGYSEFEYAKKALKYGVSEYLLKPVNREQLKNALFKIITQLNQANSSISTSPFIPSFSTKEETAEAIKEYIRVNYNKNINFEELLSQMNYSADYVTKIFSGIYGLSPVKYMISLRIHRAQHLLIHNPELTVQNIGELIGYTEVSYFSRIFKKYTGTSPGAFRKTERKRMTSSEELLYPDEDSFPGELSENQSENQER